MANRQSTFARHRRGCHDSSGRLGARFNSGFRRHRRIIARVMTMSEHLLAKVSTTIDASTSEVWKALTDPKAIKQYMFGTDVVSDWSEGSPIVWKGEFKGKPYEDKGVILEIDAQKTLQYTHFSALSGKPDKAENYHTIRIGLSDSNGATDLALTQDNNDTEQAREESEKNWGAMLDGLKKYVEK
jgi:uncharacterized protein YndB with AHSA1/START domain